MNEKLPIFLCVILLLLGAFAGGMLLSSEARSQGDGIIVEGEDDKSIMTNEYSAELANATSGVTAKANVEYGDFISGPELKRSGELDQAAAAVTSRILAEYGDFGSKLGLNRSGGLDQAAGIVSSRVVVEYADSASAYESKGSDALDQVAATVTSRIIVEYADDATTLALSPYLGPQQYLVDTSPPNITMTREPPGLEVDDSQDVFVSANITDLESGVRNATLQYTTDNSTDWSGASVHVVPMSLSLTLQPQNSLALSFDAAILGQSSGTRVRFRIIAYDFAGNNATINGVTVAATYLVVPEFPSTALLSLFAMATLCATIVCRRKRAATRTR